MVNYNIISNLDKAGDLLLSLGNAVNRNSNVEMATIVVLDNQVKNSLKALEEPISKSVAVREPTLIKQSVLKWPDSRNSFLLSLASMWSVESVPFLPEFKKQVSFVVKLPQ